MLGTPLELHPTAACFPGEPAFYRFKRVWQDGYVYAGLGSVIPLP